MRRGGIGPRAAAMNFELAHAGDLNGKEASLRFVRRGVEIGPRHTYLMRRIEAR